MVAIAAPGAAKLYELDVLQENVSQSEANKTRFYVVSRTPNKLPGYRSAVFAANMPADQLPDALEAACSNGATLVCVHDRPEKSALGVYRYVIELERADGFTDDEIARIEGATQLECLGRCARVEG
jgi:prephenate dehydratase